MQIEESTVWTQSIVKRMVWQVCKGNDKLEIKVDSRKPHVVHQIPKGKESYNSSSIH